jgi:hypothetical protein
MASEYTPKQKSDQVSWKVLLTKWGSTIPM